MLWRHTLVSVQSPRKGACSASSVRSDLVRVAPEDFPFLPTTVQPSPVIKRRYILLLEP